MKRAVIVLLCIVAVGAGGGAYYIRRNHGDIQVNTSPITRGDIIDTVASTGTLQAVTTVQVGSQVSGNIAWLGADFNSIVHKGQVIARLDPSLFQAQVEQANANLARSRADVERNKVALTDADQKYTRAKELAARNLLPQSDLDAAKTAVDSARAQLQSSEATVVQSEAALSQAKVNLDHCTITAPIDGIVIQRSVDVGQTVAASLQSPTLFVIAADLTKMQVNANVDEADVGRIRPGQHVVFRVDAYPGEDFTGTVSQVRLQPVVVQNVTTYGTIINVPNTDLRLKPGMTANLKVQIATRTDAVRVPNTALRFRPSNDVFAALNQPIPGEVQGGRGGAAGSRSARGRPGAMPDSESLPAPAPSPNANVPRETQPNLQFGGRAGSGDAGDRTARMLERFKTMSPDEQKQFIARMKERGMDVGALEKAASPAPKTPLVQPKYGAPQSPETIDALFRPLPPVESQGRLWLYLDHKLKPVRVRLGITDGTYTELLSGELQPGTEVVTGVILPGARTTSTGPGTGNPLMPVGGRGFGGPGRGR